VFSHFVFSSFFLPFSSPFLISFLLDDFLFIYFASRFRVWNHFIRSWTCPLDIWLTLPPHRLTRTLPVRFTRTRLMLSKGRVSNSGARGEMRPTSNGGVPTMTDALAEARGCAYGSPIFIPHQQYIPQRRYARVTYITQLANASFQWQDTTVEIQPLLF